MSCCIRRAKCAASKGETPVGAIIVRDGQIIGGGRNRRETTQNALCHAEIEAIHEACRRTGSWRLSDCDLYVTLEPCPMCAGAILAARIRRVCFGAYDPKAGSFGSVTDLNAYPFNHKAIITGGVREQECAALLSDFFKDLRKKKQINK